MVDADGGVDWQEVSFNLTNLCSFTRFVEPFESFIKRCQFEAFGEEIPSVSVKRHTKRSCLAELSPTLGADGILRVGGRIDAVNLPYDNWHPIILPA